ncbi:MAG: M28 family peptidase [Candidatus Omnitrophica bacterium]|nr:M28 family peptidase [Candidatus Omnitrophota bacterium]
MKSSSIVALACGLVLALVCLAICPAPAPALAIDPPIVKKLISCVDMGRLKNVVRVLVNEFGPRHADHSVPFIDDKCTPRVQEPYPVNNAIMSGLWVEQYYQKLGYKVEKVPVPLGFKGAMGFNVVAVKKGTVYPNTYIDVMSHLDSEKNCPGAEDNAPGVAATMEIAAILADYPSRYSLRFIHTMGHEHEGMQDIGSMIHVSESLKRGEVIKVGIIIDGIAWVEPGVDTMNVLDYKGAESGRVADVICAAQKKYGIAINCRKDTYSLESDNFSYKFFNQTAVLSIGGVPFMHPVTKCLDVYSRLLDRSWQNVFLTTQLDLAGILELDAE